MRCGLASTKIYTKTGDTGTTSLVSGQRISKSHIRLDAYGSIDELNSHIGLLISTLTQELSLPVSSFLKRTQNQLFNIGSHLANTDPQLAQKLPEISIKWIKDIEQEIDSMSQTLPELKNFILPGGVLPAAQAHIARTVCRRAERDCCRLLEHESAHNSIIPYINRLSDYFFVLARYLNAQYGASETSWEK